MGKEIDFIGLNLMVGGLFALMFFNLPVLKFLFDLEHKYLKNKVKKALSSNSKGFRKTADKFLKKDWPKFRFPFLLALMIQALLVLLPLDLFGKLEMALGFWIFFVLCYINADVRNWPAHLREMRINVAQAIIREDRMKLAEAVLMRGAIRNDPTVRWAVAKVLCEIPTTNSLRMLAQLRQDRDQEVAEVAELSHKTLEAQIGKSNSESEMPFDFDSFDSIVAKLQELTQMNEAEMEEIVQLQTQLDSIQNSQAALRNGFSLAFCSKCNLRAEKKKYQHWEFVTCSKCNNPHNLLLNIDTVVGQIGGDGKMTQIDGKLFLPIWDESRQTSIAADIDRLEIIGGQNISYDLAIATIWDNLEANTATGKPQLNVTLSQKPALNPQSLRLLHQLDLDLSLDLSNM